MHRFDTLYIEDRVADQPMTRAIAARFPAARIVAITHYGEIFYRRGQPIRAQKLKPALILAHADPPLLYRAPGHVSGEERRELYYNDQIRNCVFDCDYCFLQGMHPSAHLLVFVNSDDFVDAARRQASSGAFWLSVSYLSDVIAVETVAPIASQWVAFADTSPAVTVELRTKSDAEAFLSAHHARPNVVLAWTMSPPQIAQRVERGCAPFAARLRAVRRAVEAGWRVRIAIDPVLIVPGWDTAYPQMIDAVFAEVDPQSIEAVSYGPFRMAEPFYNRIDRARGDAPILAHPFVRRDGLVGYSDAERLAIDRVVGGALGKACPIIAF
ncbi:MAG: hypothetical protein EA382_18640 [Spirochaetaceae bacterium]|nr:MAG: hypothetical protein EA382_18640 [Spirochaetaceae bacterium]